MTSAAERGLVQQNKKVTGQEQCKPELNLLLKHF